MLPHEPELSDLPQAMVVMESFLHVVSSASASSSSSHRSADAAEPAGSRRPEGLEFAHGILQVGGRGGEVKMKWRREEEAEMRGGGRRRK